MKRLLSAVLCLLAPSLLLACNAGEGAGLTLTETSASRLAGALDGEGSRLTFDARAETAGRTSLVLEIGGKPFSYRVDATTGVSELDGRGAVLTAEDKRTLAALAPALESALAAPAAELPEHVRSLAAISAYWAEAPAGYAHAGRTAQLLVRRRLGCQLRRRVRQRLRRLRQRGRLRLRRHLIETSGPACGGRRSRDLVGIHPSRSSVADGVGQSRRSSRRPGRSRSRFRASARRW